MHAAGDNPHQLLLRVLKEPESYRQWMRPADIIEQNRIERRPREPISFTKSLKEFVEFMLKG